MGGVRQLGGALLAAANTANAWRPVSRHERISVLAFLAGLPTSELPLHALAREAGALAVGARRGRPSRAAMALHAASAAGLIGLEVINRRAGAVLTKALDDAGIAMPDPPDPGDAPAAKAPGAVRMARIRTRYAHHRDISYGPAGRANMLDVWSRPDVREGAPVLIQVPGGAWIMGNKEVQAYPLMSHLAERGWVCVPISYRLAPRSRWPAQIQDVKRAIAWVRDHIAEYGGDPGSIVITGGSAGGHLSSLAALTANDPAFQPRFEDADTSVAAAVPYYGAYDWVDDARIGHHLIGELLEDDVVGRPLEGNRELYEAASPMHRIHEDAPPFLILHGTTDSLIPVEQGRAFAERLRAVSNQPVAYAELPFAQHAFDVFGSPRSAATAAAVERFAGAVLAARGEPALR